MRFYLTQRAKIENLVFLRGTFPNTEVTDPTRPDPTKAAKKLPNLTQVKNFDPDPSPPTIILIMKILFSFHIAKPLGCKC